MKWNEMEWNGNGEKRKFLRSFFKWNGMKCSVMTLTLMK